MEEPLVRVSHSGSVRTLTLNRPQALNSFTGAMHGELRAALDAAAGDREVRCVVVTGAGRGFCAGQDLADPAVAPNRDAGGAADRRRLGDRALLQAAGAAHPLDAGAGRSPRSTASPPAPARTSRCCCDIVVAARSASFIQAFSKIGLVPDCGGTWLLPRLVGRANALGLAMLGDKLGGRGRRPRSA